MISSLPTRLDSPPAGWAIDTNQIVGGQGRLSPHNDRDAEERAGTDLHRNRTETRRNDNNDQIDLAITEQCGDTIMERDNDTTLRIEFLNINGIPPQNSHTKNNSLFTAIADHYLDIIGMTETNLCWTKLQSSQRWRHRTVGWWETSSSILAHNINDIRTSTFQP